MTNDERPLSVAAGKIAELAVLLDAAPMLKHSGAWIHQVDEHWKVAVNGHRHVVAVPATADCMGVGELKPFEFAIFFNGWLAGIFDSFGGIFVFGGEANEDSFIAAMDAAIAKGKKQ